jgi:hypothetical protein
MSDYDSHPLIQDLPPLPTSGGSASETCAIIRLYLAVESDLAPEQARAVVQHVRTCEECAHEQQVLRQASRLVASLTAPQPSSRVDQAVQAAIAARRNQTATRPPVRVISTPLPRSARRRRRTGLVALVAAVVLAVLSSAYFMIGGNPFASHRPVLQLPANLSWNSYVLYYTQTRSGNDGSRYLVMSYHDMGSHQANLQYIIPGKMDIKVVMDQQKSLGLDMMHHVAQWDVEQWANFDLSMFDLQRLRQDLQKGQAVYEGKGRFKGQDVYRVRYPGDHILLLDMQYMPVNVLEKSHQQEQPMYDTVRWFSPAQVASSMWDMTVPSDFAMGELPPMP